MIYILAYIIFSSAFTLCIKWVHVRGSEDMTTIGMINYVVAFLAVGGSLAVTGPRAFDVAAVACGASMGFTYFIAFFFVTYAVRSVGAASTTVVGVLSMVIPILAGIAIWNESPNAWQIAGVLLALVALTLIGSAPRAKGGASLPTANAGAPPAEGGGPEEQVAVEAPGWVPTLVLVIFFLLCGNNRLSQEVFKHLSFPEFRPLFLTSAFCVAAIPSLFVLLYRRRPIRRREWLLGVGLGSTNLVQSFFILRALQYLDAFVVFPFASAGAVMLTTLVATLFLHERLSTKAWIGIGIACVALILLYWLPGNPEKPAAHAANSANYQPAEPPSPFQGPTISEVTQPP